MIGAVPALCENAPKAKPPSSSFSLFVEAAATALPRARGPRVPRRQHGRRYRGEAPPLAPSWPAPVPVFGVDCEPCGLADWLPHEVPGRKVRRPLWPGMGLTADMSRGSRAVWTVADVQHRWVCPCKTRVPSLGLASVAAGIGFTKAARRATATPNRRNISQDSTVLSGVLYPVHVSQERKG